MGYKATAIYICVSLNLLAVLISGELPKGVLQCPSVCLCLGNTVDCSKRSLSSIPSDLPDWMEMLDLSENQLTSIEPNTFSGLHRLTELKLAYNKLSVIPFNFTAANLTHLNLAHNAIESLDPAAVSILTGIRTLDLSFNRISQVRNGSFPALSNLMQLFLNGNSIVTIDRGAFENLTSLEWLKLSKNKIKSLYKNTFSTLKKLKTLELERNRLQSIEGLVFQGLDSLLLLKLKRNDISQLMDGAFWGLKSLENLDLSHNNISVVHNKWLYGLETLQHLSLNHNVVSEIEKDVWIYCSVLVVLDLRFNRLTALNKNVFKGLESLKHLLLGHNHIAYVADEGFKRLNSLLVLDLSYNNLSWTIEDTNMTFDYLPSLTRLMLQNNQIKSISSGTFSQLTSLRQLHLEENNISTVQENAFSAATNLRELRLNSSLMLCDCHLSWLPRWLEHAGFTLTTDVRCRYPEALNGLSLFDVGADDFKCVDLARPVITLHPQSVKALRMGNISLTCEATSSSTEQLSIEWKRDHQIMQTSAALSTTMQENGVMRVLSRLSIELISDEHAGVYQCIAVNILGSSFSNKAQLSVNVYPTFIKTPSDVVVKLGTTARLDCAASGLPVPEIALQKDGGDDFPAARERRMHIYPSDEVFFIVDIKAEDDGVYTCIAQNDVGVIKANATLNVLEPPTFIRKMLDKVTAEGETTVLECMTSGKPRPRLEWLKDSVPLDSTVRHYFTADGQLLVIVESRRSDAGRYTCIVSNALGSERQVAKLSIVDPVTGAILAEPDSALSQSDQSVSVTIGIVIIAVVCCVVGTSLVWVIVIYKSAQRRSGRDLCCAGLCCCTRASSSAARVDEVYKVQCYGDMMAGPRIEPGGIVREGVTCYHSATLGERNGDITGAQRLLGPTHSFTSMDVASTKHAVGCSLYRLPSSSSATVALLRDKERGRRHSDYTTQRMHGEGAYDDDVDDDLGDDDDDDDKVANRLRSDSGTHTASSSLSGSTSSSNHSTVPSTDLSVPSTDLSLLKVTRTPASLSSFSKQPISEIDMCDTEFKSLNYVEPHSHSPDSCGVNIQNKGSQNFSHTFINDSNRSSVDEENENIKRNIDRMSPEGNLDQVTAELDHCKCLQSCTCSGNTFQNHANIINVYQPLGLYDSSDRRLDIALNCDTGICVKDSAPAESLGTPSVVPEGIISNTCDRIILSTA